MGLLDQAQETGQDHRDGRTPQHDDSDSGDAQGSPGVGERDGERSFGDT